MTETPGRYNVGDRRRLTAAEMRLAAKVQLIALKLSCEHLAKVSPEKSAQEWETHFIVQCAQLMKKHSPEELEIYLETRFPS